jgi:hypothetical protein
MSLNTRSLVTQIDALHKERAELFKNALVAGTVILLIAWWKSGFQIADWLSPLIR